MNFTKHISIILLIFLFAFAEILAQESFPINGPQNKLHTTYAIVHATIFKTYNTKIENATLIYKDGQIIDCGVNVSIPINAVIIDAKGKFIYPSFIDAFTSYGLPDLKKEPKNAPQMESATKGAVAWNQALKSDARASNSLALNIAQAEEFRNNGFGTVHTFIKDGIARGTGTVVTLADGKENELILNANASANYSFDKGTSTQDYPNSLMGTIALLRQTYLDATWYKNGGNKEQVNLSLDAWNNTQNLPQIFEANGKLNVLRAAKIASEFNVNYVIKSNGDEYQRADEIKQTKATLIIPINFPATPDVEDPYDAAMLELDDLKHWELAPYNLGILEKKQIPFCISATDLKTKNDFLPNLRKAVKYGLTDTAALKALTRNPANILNIYSKVGSLEKGKLANFIITSGNIFKDKTVIYDNYIQGKKYGIKDWTNNNLKGILKISGVLISPINVSITEKDLKYQASAKIDTSKINCSINATRNLINISFTHNKNLYKLSGAIKFDNENNATSIAGSFIDSLGIARPWSAVYMADTAIAKTNAKDSAETIKIVPKIIYPFISYGFNELPTQKKYLVKNATIWTNETDGVLKETDVLIDGGKIVQIGKNISSANAIEIDGKNKHLTAGIIDEHSHIAISSGVNESSQTSTAEVRIGDVVNCDDINIYRQLSGGVVAAQLLHGSANAIGGQSALVKLRWGNTPEKMKIEGADGFIKFALGENVKQSNWGSGGQRYPQTRMGVEQVYYDAFTRAREYDLAIKNTANKNVRRDLDLETLAEILNKKRVVTCHSYIQSEINMLIHVADSFKFTINTFTHILEGYKVADKMKKHGVGASTFADWWAYKFEVMEAIPYNAAILHDMGVTVAINSDDAEMGRRLNQESAKAIKYGGLSEEEALKLCTLNPAKLLHLDNKMGSIKIGKYADVVLWNNNPLSIYARVEKTFVDGILYYDLQHDIELRSEIAQERESIIRKMIAAKKNGEKTEKPKQKNHINYGCDD